MHSPSAQIGGHCTHRPVARSMVDEVMTAKGGPWRAPASCIVQGQSAARRRQPKHQCQQQAWRQPRGQAPLLLALSSSTSHGRCHMGSSACTRRNLCCVGGSDCTRLQRIARPVPHGVLQRVAHAVAEVLRGQRGQLSNLTHLRWSRVVVRLCLHCHQWWPPMAPSVTAANRQPASAPHLQLLRGHRVSLGQHRHNRDLRARAARL